jgi:hypothetical protein
MIRIAITGAAFEAIAATLPLGSLGFESATNEKSERLIWLEPNVVDSPQGHARAGRVLQRHDPEGG